MAADTQQIKGAAQFAGGKVLRRDCSAVGRCDVQVVVIETQRCVILDERQGGRGRIQRHPLAGGKHRLGRQQPGVVSGGGKRRQQGRDQHSARDEFHE